MWVSLVASDFHVENKQKEAECGSSQQFYTLWFHSTSAGFGLVSAALNFFISCFSFRVLYGANESAQKERRRTSLVVLKMFSLISDQYFIPVKKPCIGGNQFECLMMQTFFNFMFFLYLMCFCSRWRLERVEQVVSLRCRLFYVEEQGVHPALTWHRRQRLPGGRPPVPQLYQRAVSTE